MGERSDGTWAARHVALSTPRQNGKSQLIVARALAGVLLFGEQTIIVSAHQQDTAREVFSRILDLIESHQVLESRVSDVMRAINRESITFKSGQQIRFKARSKGGGRGFSCDCLLLDEAQTLGSAAWSAILPTMSARPNPQAWLMGTPPTELDDGEVFERLRQLGTAAKEPRLAYLEWAAERDDDPADPQTWAKANPSYGARISHEAIASEFASMSAEQFAEERLGIWRVDDHKAVFTVAEWENLAARGPALDERPAVLAVDMSHKREISVAACWHTDGGLFAEEAWAGVDSAAATQWLIARAARRIPILVDGVSPAASLVPGLKAARAKVTVTSAADMVKACGLVYDMAKAGTLLHGENQDALAAAAVGARKRPIRDAGGWGWDRRDETVNIAPLVAFTLSVLGASSTRKKPNNSQGRRVVVL
jgi:hypothetical protein